MLFFIFRVYLSFFFAQSIIFRAVCVCARNLNYMFSTFYKGDFLVLFNKSLIDFIYTCVCVVWLLGRVSMCCVYIIELTCVVHLTSLVLFLVRNFLLTFYASSHTHSYICIYDGTNLFFVHFQG